MSSRFATLVIETSSTTPVAAMKLSSGPRLCPTRTSFSGAKPIDANGNLQTNFGYSPGSAGDIVVVRLMYEWPIYVSLLGFNLADMSGNKRLIIATAAFRNEPYQ